MGLIDFPDPVSWYESAKNAGLERNAATQVLSSAYSFWITAMWGLGQRKYLSALADGATAMYLSLHRLEGKDLPALTVPAALVDPKNLSRFQTEANSNQEKKTK